MKELDGVELYTINFCYREGYLEFMLQTDFIIKAEDEGLAFEVAKEMESDISVNIAPYYDKKREEIIVEVKENRHFKKVVMNRFKEQMLNENGFRVDGEMLSKEEFLRTIERSKEDYLKENERLPFEYVSYKIQEIN